MKKVILISFFKSNNMGDRLIAAQLIKLLGDTYKIIPVDFSVLKKQECIKSSDSNLKKSAFGEAKKFITKFSIVSTLKILFDTPKKLCVLLEKNSDAYAVILAGGNMIMDMKTFPIYTLKSYLILKMAKEYKKKTATIFVGVGPFQNRLQRLYAKKVAKLSDYISVRDEKSKELLKNISPNSNIDTLYDPVLTIEGKRFQRALAIGVSVYFGTNEKEHIRIKEAYVRIIKGLRKKLPEYKIILYSSELNDYKYVNEVYNEFSDDMVAVRKINNEQELLDIYKEFDVLLGARMHSLITSLVMRTPIIAFAWQEKVWGFSEMVDMKDRFYPIEELDDYIDEIIEKVQNIIRNLKNESEEIDKRLNKICKKIKESLGELVTVF